jgi:hypothetical protein
MLRATIAVLCLISLALISQAEAQPPALVEVFTPYQMPVLAAAENTTLQRLRQEHGAAEVTVVRLNVQALTGALANEPRTLSLAGGIKLGSVTRQTTALGNGRVLWKGDIPATSEGLPAGDAVLVVDGSSATGTVSAPDGRRFQIRPLGGDATAIIRLDFQRLAAEEPPGHPALSGPANPTLNAAPLADLADASPTVDLLVVYTDAAAKASGGINGLIDLAAIETNDSFVNSGVNARVRVVGRALVAINETGKTYEQIMAAAVSDAGVDAERNNKRADVVVMIINQRQWCGLANAIQASASQAYVLVHYGCATGYYSFGHEIGHLIGARHDVAMDNSSAPYPYGHGLTHPSATNPWRTIMAYACAPVACNPRIQNWANPSVTYAGSSTGDAQTANNARVWNERAAVVAAFR